MADHARPPLFRKIDCLRLPVPDLDAGLAFYQEQLGHELIWRTATQAGLRLPDTEAELVLQIEQPTPEVDLLVTSVEEAVAVLIGVGGRLVVPAFDIQIGQCARVEDPWGNLLTLLDVSKGSLVTDPFGNVIDPLEP
jgi:catechol 2,3-dioxygenase-like lactoylglutathione lyase family enzyme